MKVGIWDVQRMNFSNNTENIPAKYIWVTLFTETVKMP